MAQRRFLAGLLAISLVVNAFCVPSGPRLPRGFADNEVDSSNTRSVAISSIRTDASSTTPQSDVVKTSDDDDDDDDEFQVTPSSSSSSGSNILSLLNLVSGLFPGSSSSNVKIRKALKKFVLKNQSAIKKIMNRLENRRDSEIETNFIADLRPPPPPFQRQETEENETNESGDSQNDTQESLEEDNGGEESIENNSKPAKQSSDSDAASDGNGDDDDYDEPPGGGDGAGGGVLGLLAGLSGSEDGQSDLGSLLAAVSGIVANLSGDGFDLNALIASGIGLFVGLLSEGEENPGAVIASYLLTSLDTITGGGAKNNGAFFGTFLSKLIKGSSAGEAPDDSDENGGMVPKDSGGFFASLLMGLLGEMSKTSSGGSSKPW